MRHRVLIVDDACDPAELGTRDLAPYSDLVALCWLSPATREGLQAHGRLRCHGLLDVVGSLERWERRAITRMEQVCAAGPRYRDRPWRFLLAEGLFREALVIQLVADADRLRRQLAGDRPGGYDLRVSAERERLFRALTADVGPAAGPPAPRPPLPARLARRLRHSLVTGDLGGQLRNLLDQLDAGYRWRCAAGRWRRPAVAPGGVTFFSSYLNNSRVVRILEPHVPDPVHWVVTNHYARTGAAGHRGTLSWLWHFAPGTAAKPVDRQAAAAESDEPKARAWLAGSPTWRYWLGAGRSSLPRLTAAWEHYLDRARPRLVVVANQWGLEGWFSGLARRRGIPVLQLLHGVLDGEFYCRQPIAADALVVWGEAWRDLRPADERPRIRVFNPPSAFPPVERRPAAVPRLTYFSWPFDRTAFYNEAELQDGFIELLGRLQASADCELTVRAHPLENPADLLGRWRRHHGDLPPPWSVSQREPLRDVLARTDVAILFRSTVMLECLASGIPMIIPRWPWFTWQERLEDIRGVHLAADFDDLLATALAWIRDPPPMDRRQTRGFLRPVSKTGEGLEQFVSDLIERGGAREP